MLAPNIRRAKGARKSSESLSAKQISSLLCWVLVLVVGYVLLFGETVPDAQSEQSTNLIGGGKGVQQEFLSAQFEIPAQKIDHYGDIVVAVLPSFAVASSGPSGEDERIESIRDTWASQVRTIFFSQQYEKNDIENDDGFSVVRIPASHQIHGPANFRWAVDYMIDHGMKESQILLLVSEVSYLIPENLDTFVDRVLKKQGTPLKALYVGNRLTIPGTEEVFHSGGAGVFLSRATLTNMRHEWEIGRGECYATDDYLKENPDIVLSRCMKFLKISPMDPSYWSLASSEDSGNLLSVYSPVRMISGDVDEWYKSYQTKSSLLATGIDCCSVHIMSFHFVLPQEARTIFAMLHNPSLFMSLSREQKNEVWNRSEQMFSFSKGLESLDEKGIDELWTLLTSKINLRGTLK